MRYLIIIFIIVLGIILGILLLPKQKGAGDAVEPFTLTTMLRKKYHFDNEMKKISCIVFFSLNDEHSRELFSLFPFLTNQFTDQRNIRFIAIATDGSHERLQLFMSQYRFPGDVLLDTNQRVMKAFGISELPAFFVVDKKNEISFSQSGWNRDRLRELVPAIKQTRERNPPE